MPVPTVNNSKRDAFVKSVIEAAHVGEITHCEARELIQEWFDMYPWRGEHLDLTLDFFERVIRPPN